MPYDSPEDLRRLNRIELIAMGVEAELAERFLSHRWFSPRHQTRFVSALAGLELASGRRALVEAALHARSEYDAIFYQSAAELLNGYALEHPIRRLAPVNRIAVGVTEEGEVVIPLRVDHAVWTRPVEAWAEDVRAQATHDLDAKRVVVLLTGTISPKAREEFAARSLEVRERAGRAR